MSETEGHSEEMPEPLPGAAGPEMAPPGPVLSADPAKEPAFPSHIRFEIGSVGEVEQWVKDWVHWKLGRG